MFDPKLVRHEVGKAYRWNTSNNAYMRSYVTPQSRRVARKSLNDSVVYNQAINRQYSKPTIRRGK